MLEFTALSDKDLAVTKTNFHATDPAAESSIGVFSSNRDVKRYLLFSSAPEARGREGALVLSNYGGGVR